MQLTDTPLRYGLVHQLLHWSVALLILVMIPMGGYMHDLPTTNAAEIEHKVWLYGLHKSIGVAALGLAVLRIVWTASQTKVAPLHDGLEGFAARTVHTLLYVSILLVPITGWIHHAASTGYSPLWWGFGDTLPLVPKSEAVSAFFATAHWIAAITLVISLVLHIAGAVKHAVIDRDGTLARMVPGTDTSLTLTVHPHPKDRRPLAAAFGVLLVASAAVFTVHNLGYGHSVEAAAPAATETVEAPVSNGAWVIDKSASTLGITFQQMGQPVQGAFGEWSADVVFDPDEPEAAKIEATVATASLDIGSETARATGDEFLNAAANPQARFVSTSVAKTETGFRAMGDLTLAAITAPAVIDFTFAETDGVATVTAIMPLKRLDFGVGQAGFGDGSTVGLDVDVTMDIRATRP